MDSIGKFTIKYRWYILAFTVLVTGFFAFQFKFLEVDSNVVDALPADDEVVQLFKEVGDRFGSNQIGLVILKADNVFQPQTLEHIQQVTDTISDIPGVVSVTSITNMMSFRGDGDNFEVDNLISRSRWPESEADIAELTERVTSNELVEGTLVAPDASSTIILFYFAHDGDIKAISGDVIRHIDRLGLPEDIYYAGSSFLTSYVAEIMGTEMMKLIPIAFVLIAAILFFSFRSGLGVVLPLLAAGLAIVWAIGTFSLMGFKLSMVSNNVPIIVLAVGSAYSIHVFNRVRARIGEDAHGAIKAAMHLIAWPVLLAGLTTMVGFVSFVFGAYLSMIRDFGILAALGTLYATLLALFLVPALMAILYRQKSSDSAAPGDSPFLQRYVLGPIHRWNTTSPRRVLAVWGSLIALGIIGMLQVERSVSVADYFKRSHPANRADKIMEADYGGSKPIFVVFKGDIQDPEVLRGMHDFATYLVSSSFVTSTQSIVDVVVKLNNALSDEKGIPEEKSTVQQLWFFLEQQDLSQLVTEDLDEAVIMAKFNNAGHANIAGFNAYVDEYLANLATDKYTIAITGMPYVNTQLDRSLVRSQTTSLLLAVLLVIALVSFIFKSVVEGLTAATPIIATIITLYGFMGFSGIPLNVVTVLVASVAMGIGIDYSIHYISSFNLALQSSGQVKNALQEATFISGKSIFVNFISVSMGFLILAFSDLMPMVYFGILIALSMLGSAMGALTLLPAMLLMRRK